MGRSNQLRRWAMRRMATPRDRLITLVACALIGFAIMSVLDRGPAKIVQSCWVVGDKGVCYLPNRTQTIVTSSSKNKIPKIIHQSWKTHSLPTKFQKWSDSWKKHNPGYEYKLWTDEDNRNLVLNDYPWFLDTYDNLKMNIMRVDSVRYMYMHKYGGVYADLDMECLRPMDELLQGDKVVLAFMGDDEHLPNAWMASEPGREFWLFALSSIMKLQKTCTTLARAESMTGPDMLIGTTQLYVCSPHYDQWTHVTILDPTKIYPYDWDKHKHLVPICSAQQDTFDAEACKKHFPDAFAITYWSHSWEGENKVITKG